MAMGLRAFDSCTQDVHSFVIAETSTPINKHVVRAPELAAPPVNQVVLTTSKVVAPAAPSFPWSHVFPACSSCRIVEVQDEA